MVRVEQVLFLADLDDAELDDAELDDAELDLLALEIRRAAIEREGSSVDAFYRTPEGKPGSYQDQFRVYGRAGEPCPACDTPIEYLLVGQRGTHVCPTCQPKPRKRRKAKRRVAR